MKQEVAQPLPTVGSLIMVLLTSKLLVLTDTDVLHVTSVRSLFLSLYLVAATTNSR